MTVLTKLKHATVIKYTGSNDYRAVGPVSCGLNVT